MASSFLRGCMAFLAVAQALTAVTLRIGLSRAASSTLT